MDTVGAKLLVADLGNSQTALQLRDAALQSVRSVTSGRDDPRLQALQVEALLALGRKAQTSALLKTLRSGGYRDPALLDVLQREHVEYPANIEFARRIAVIMQGDAARHTRAAQDARSSPFSIAREADRNPTEQH
jgi:eukaryotic-like serine/threonine-protein kinase